MATALKIANTLASGATVYQEKQQHLTSLQEEERLHHISMQEMQKQFNGEMQAARRTYLLSMYADMETYFQELNENLISSSRDSERDMVDQRNQQFQTILISATIMLATLLNIMFQGTLQPDLHWLFYAGFALFNTLSLVSLFINVALCILITSRVTKFMYRKSDANIKHLRKAMRHTKHMMRNLRGTCVNASDRYSNTENPYNADESPDLEMPTPHNPDDHTLPEAFPILDSLPVEPGFQRQTDSATEHTTANNSHPRPRMFPQFSYRSEPSSHISPDPPSPTRPAMVSMRKNIALLSDEDIEKEWMHHEQQVTEYLTHRSRLAERLEAMAVEQENQERMSFELFWTKYCRTMANTALVLFYFGTACLLIGTMIFAWTNFIIIYKSDISAISSVATIGVSLVICGVLAIYLRFFDSSIALLNAQMAREQHQEAKKYWRRMWDALRSNPVELAPESKEN